MKDVIQRGAQVRQGPHLVERHVWIKGIDLPWPPPEYRYSRTADSFLGCAMPLLIIERVTERFKIDRLVGTHSSQQVLRFLFSQRYDSAEPPAGRVANQRQARARTGQALEAGYL